MNKEKIGIGLEYLVRTPVVNTKQIERPEQKIYENRPKKTKMIGDAQ